VGTALSTCGRPAAERGAVRSAEAIACFEQALGVLDRLPKSREAMGMAFDILCDLRTVLEPLGEYDRLKRS